MSLSIIISYKYLQPLMNTLLAPSAPKDEKILRDMSKLTEQRISEAGEIKKTHGLNAALDILLLLEKQTRMAMDVHSTSMVLECILRLCYEDRNYDCMKEYLVTMSKRRGQLRQSIACMVRLAVTFIPELPTEDDQLAYIEVIRTVTSGKIYVELERAHVTKTMADIYEKRQDKLTAKTLLLELAVETYGSMALNERIEYILDQMRLCIETKDIIRANIISKKIHSNTFKSGDLNQLKLKYHQLCIQMDEPEDKHDNICKNYKNMYDIAVKLNDSDMSRKYMENVIIYGILSDFSPESLDFLLIISREQVLASMPTFRHLLKMFIKRELINIPVFESLFTETLQKHVSLASQSSIKLLNTRIIEHNCRVISHVYTQIHLSRFSELTGMAFDTFESKLSEIISSGMICASIDRPSGIVSFTKELNANEHLNSWSSGINQLMNLVEKSSHLINLARANPTSCQ